MKSADVFKRADVDFDQLRLRGANDAADDRRTPPHIFLPLDAEFDFTLDAAATAGNALCPRYFTPEQDGLVESWEGEHVWCNPPYTEVGAWVKKAWLEHATAPVIVLLVPANRTEQRWWQEMVEPTRDRGAALRTRFLAGRIDFDRPPGTRGLDGGPTCGSVLLIWQA